MVASAELCVLSRLSTTVTIRLSLADTVPKLITLELLVTVFEPYSTL